MTMAAKTTPNIYIIGAQCTGKTTLVNALRQYVQSDPDLKQSTPHIISEVARTVLQKHGFTADDIRSSPGRSLALQRLILDAQFAAERSALEGNGWFISDRSGVDPIVYATRYVSKDSATLLCQSDEWLELRGRMAASLVIVCEAGCDWLADDGVRLMPEDREDWVQFHEMFCKFLDEAGLDYQQLPSSLEDLSSRVKFVVSKREAKISKEKLGPA